jgi:hypothetical protein
MTLSTMTKSFVRAALRRVSPSMQQRAITTTGVRSWDEVRSQHHASELHNPHLAAPQTVAVIGAPMTCAFRRGY